MEQDNNAPGSLHDLLSEATEEKTPGKTINGGGWADLEDISEEPIENDEKITSNDADHKKEEPTNRALDLKYKATAQTGTILFETLLTGIGGYAAKQQFQKQINPDEIKIIEEHNLADRELDDIEQEYKIYKRKLDRLTKKLEKKIKAMPLDAGEKDATYNAIYQYSKITGIDLSPTLILISTLGSIAAHRTAVILAD